MRMANRISRVLHLLKKNGNSLFYRSAHSATSTTTDGSGHVSTKLEFIEPESMDPIPMYQVLGKDGHLLDPQEQPQIEDSVILKMYRDMVRLNVMDQILFDCQRQGRISFYLTNYGEEGIQIGSASGLDPKDLVFGQYREAGVLMWRDFPISQFLHQCYGNRLDWNKGRQMPIHYGSKEANFVTISPTLATQMPQAAGAAYSFKRKQNGQCVMCYFGDGATSEGDAHAGFNFASVLNCPVIYLCRNNGYAISTPSKEQYKGDGIASRGIGYGMASIRVDGNDVFAMHNVTKAARHICVTENRPVLIEAITYRVGHHSTSDDSYTYRSEEEVREWDSNSNPITRLKSFLTNQNFWDEDRDEELKADTRKEVVNAMAAAESELKCNPDEMFGDVYDKMPDRLKNQREELRHHLKAYKENYALEQFEQ